jgi:hypothetical protein
MGHGPQTFRVADVKRAIEGARGAGIKIGKVVITKAGHIEITPDDVKSAGETPEDIKKLL